MTHEMVTWLGGVLDRIEQKATAADPPPSAEDAEFGDTRSVWTDPHGEFRSRGGPVFEHVLTHSPANVLPLVAALRAVLAEHESGTAGTRTVCSVCAEPPYYDATWYDYPCPTLRHLAAGFSHWPGYRTEWGPAGRTPTTQTLTRRRRPGPSPGSGPPPKHPLAHQARVSPPA